MPPSRGISAPGTSENAAGNHLSARGLRAGRTVSGLESGQDPTDQIVELSVKNGWGLHELVGAQASVEEVFVELTNENDVTNNDNG